MTVKELINRLSKFEDNLLVLVDIDGDEGFRVYEVALGEDGSVSESPIVYIKVE